MTNNSQLRIKNTELNMDINYNNTSSEVLAGFKQFWKRYRRTHAVLMTIAYAIAFALGVNMIVLSPVNFYGYILTVMGGGLGVKLWTDPARARKKLAARLAAMPEEHYAASFTDETITITTRFGDETPEQKQLIRLSSEQLDSDETKDCFLLYVNKKILFVFPKRCLSESEQAGLREYFNDKNI